MLTGMEWNHIIFPQHVAGIDLWLLALDIKRVKRHTARSPQYNKLISASKGALHTDKRFFTRKRRRESEMSARKPTTKVKVDIERPRMVRKTKCHP
jgi:hypothetical protein